MQFNQIRQQKRSKIIGLIRIEEIFEVSHYYVQTRQHIKRRRVMVEGAAFMRSPQSVVSSERFFLAKNERLQLKACVFPYP